MHQKIVLQISSLTKKISKRQTEFNLLNQRIEELTGIIHALKIGQTDFYNRMSAEVYPLQRRMIEDRTAIIYSLERIYDTADWKKGELKKLAHFIASLCIDLIQGHQIDELIPLYNRTSGSHFERSSNSDPSIEEEYEAQETREEYDFSNESWESDNQDYKERYSKERANKRINKKAKKQADKQFKSVRSIYLELAKALHPDKEQDEKERERKTEIMQRVTVAYKNNDLQLLLQLQMEYNHIDQDHLDQLQDDQLLYYNLLLKQQIEELEQQKLEIARDLSRFVDLAPEKIENIEQVYFQFNADVKQIKKTAKKLKSELPLWANEQVVSEFIKTYEYD